MTSRIMHVKINSYNASELGKQRPRVKSCCSRFGKPGTEDEWNIRECCNIMNNIVAVDKHNLII